MHTRVLINFFIQIAGQKMTKIFGKDTNYKSNGILVSIAPLFNILRKLVLAGINIIYLQIDKTPYGH